jgi:23S rRNA (pseudouridine1915-N3)-methyltransferase
MKILLIVIGKTDEQWLQQGLDIFIKRIGFYVPFEMKVLSDVRNTRNLTPDEQKSRQAEQLLPIIEGKNEVFLLDERGSEYTSREFRELIFIIGGPYGFSEGQITKSAGKISLSKLTFSHQMVRLLFLEQLYRALTIIRGEPYHHD